MQTPAPSPAVLDELKAALGPGGWTQDPAVIAPALTEWRNRWTGHTPILLTPRSTEETARAVAICAREGVAITPQGGGTGLVGGQIPFGEVLLSTRKMRAVRDVTPLDDAMTVEAVMPNGEIFRGLKRLRKDNTGYDLKQLLIGAEGTLGVVTAATLKLFPIMRSRA